MAEHADPLERRYQGLLGGVAPAVARVSVLRRLSIRAASLALTLLAVSAAIFLVLDVLPGDPAAIMLGTSARPDTLAALRAELGLDQAALWRYLAWLGGLLHADFGMSVTYSLPVRNLIAERLAVTLPLAAIALLIVVAFALPLGVAAAARRGWMLDLLATILSQVGVAVPNFWLGLIFILVFATGLGWLPAGGFPGWDAGFWNGIRSLILPAFALALPQAAVLTRVVRSATLEVIGADFVRTARAKGVSSSRTLIRNVVPNALIPVATIVGLQLSFLIAGAILVENVFNLPGLGRLAFQALAQRDLVVMRAVVLVLAAIVIGVNALVDLAHLFLDPRLRSRA
jgi:peptide/nickel transport system permease protein